MEIYFIYEGRKIPNIFASLISRLYLYFSIYVKDKYINECLSFLCSISSYNMKFVDRGLYLLLEFSEVSQEKFHELLELFEIKGENLHDHVIGLIRELMTHNPSFLQTSIKLNVFQATEKKNPLFIKRIMNHLLNDTSLFRYVYWKLHVLHNVLSEMKNNEKFKFDLKLILSFVFSQYPKLLSKLIRSQTSHEKEKNLKKSSCECIIYLVLYLIKKSLKLRANIKLDDQRKEGSFEFIIPTDLLNMDEFTKLFQNLSNQVLIETFINILIFIRENDSYLSRTYLNFLCEVIHEHSHKLEENDPNLLQELISNLKLIFDHNNVQLITIAFQCFGYLSYKPTFIPYIMKLEVPKKIILLLDIDDTEGIYKILKVNGLNCLYMLIENSFPKFSSSLENTTFISVLKRRYLDWNIKMEDKEKYTIIESSIQILEKLCKIKTHFESIIKEDILENIWKIFNSDFLKILKENIILETEEVDPLLSQILSLISKCLEKSKMTKYLPTMIHLILSTIFKEIDHEIIKNVLLSFILNLMKIILKNFPTLDLSIYSNNLKQFQGEEEISMPYSPRDLSYVLGQISKQSK